MAKLNVTVENDLDSVKLISQDKMNKKKKGNTDKKVKDNKKTKNKPSKKGKTNYLKQVASEMRLVTWPTKKKMVKYSITTIVMIAMLALFFFGLTALFDLLYSLVQGWIG